MLDWFSFSIHNYGLKSKYFWSNNHYYNGYNKFFYTKKIRLYIPLKLVKGIAKKPTQIHGVMGFIGLLGCITSLSANV